jgi:hypothetical protein
MSNTKEFKAFEALEAELLQGVEDAQADLDEAKETLKMFNIVASRVGFKKAKTRSSLGRPKKEALTEAKKKVLAAKAETKAKPKTKTKSNTKTKPKKSNIAAGRRAVADGLRPSLKEAMVKVMGNKAMGAADVLMALEDRDWVPNAAKPQQYISCTFSSSKDIFERVEGKRGIYKVKDGAVFSKKPTKKGNGKKAKKGAKVSDKELANLGIQKGAVQANPFND